MKNKAEYICRICWYEDYEPFWLETGWPSWQICVCCWSESWYYDTLDNAIKNNRKKWIEWWCKWFDPKEKPENWDIEEQMKNIPEKYLYK